MHGHLVTVRVVRHFVHQRLDQRQPAIMSLLESVRCRTIRHKLLAEAAALIGRGIPTREIAKQLHLSIKTIETHREHIKEKLGLANSTELTRHAVQWVLEDN